MAVEYSRPASGFRFKNGGMKTNAAPDVLPPDKYQLLLNARSYSDDEISCRPGMSQLFTTSSGSPIHSIGSYSQGQGQIRYLATSGANVYLDSGTGVDAGVFDSTEIQSIFSYRPNQSVAPWMYIGDRQAYRKYSFPSPSVTANKAGIAEPQAPVDACLSSALLTCIGEPAGTSTYATFGTGGGLSLGSRNSDGVINAFTDPAGPVQYVQTTLGHPFNKHQCVLIHGQLFEVLDVFQSCPFSLQIQGIYYYTGSTGRCVIVPGNIGAGPGNDSASIFTNPAVASLRRGSIITIGTEVAFVLGVSLGPDGQISFETSTANTHSTADTLTINSGIAVYAGGIAPGNAITSPDYQFAVGVGIGGLQVTGIGGVTVNSLNAFQDGDYFHFSINVDNLTNLTEAKILFDVGDGSFTQNFYYYAVRPADIQAGVSNTLTQLGAAQLYGQREVIEEEGKAQHIAASTQTPPGSSQWAEIFVPIGELIRVGNDETATLLNINSLQVLCNCTGTINVKVNSITFRGAYKVDCGDTGGPYRYRVRPRSSLTGALGNPSPDMRYGVSPRRDQVIVTVPATAYDTQFNFWDVFRLGGVLTNWTFVGTVHVGTTQFIDIYDDTTIQNSQQLDFDNLEPWPSIDNPFAASCSVVGTVAVVTGGGASKVLNYLPGNKVTIGQNVFTLWTRPTNGIGGTFIFQFQENAGSLAGGTPLRIYEPSFANNNLPYIWGPSDEGGVVFGAGDSFRPGTVSFCKNFAPDSVPDSYNLELSPPSEPIMGGVFAGGLSFAFTSFRVFPLRPSFGGVNQWTPSPSFGPGLASSFGIATDGRLVWYVGTDGIYQLSPGNGQSLTAADLSNIFPHDGVPPLPTTGASSSFFQPPDYTQAESFRLAHCDGYLYFDFIDLNGTQQTLVYDVGRGAWSLDKTSPRMVMHYNVIQPQSSASGGASTLPVMMLMGDATGVVYEQVIGAEDVGGHILFQVITSEYTGGEERALKQWGDVYVNALPSFNGMNVVPVTGGANQSQLLVLGGLVRTTGVLSAGNVNHFSLGINVSSLYIAGIGRPIPTVYIWQPSYIPQPVIEVQRFTDWDDAGMFGNKMWQGFIMEANTNGVNKNLQVRDADGNGFQPFTPTPNFPRQSEQAFSFTQPFVAHSVRIEPQDAINWNLWKVRWITVPYPEAAETWYTEGVTHGLLGFQHIYFVNLAYIATQPVTLTLSTDQGPVPVLTFPATGSHLAPVKKIMKSTLNKFKVVSYQFQCSVPFFLWKDLCETWVKQWGTTGPYSRVNPFGGDSEMSARV